MNDSLDVENNEQHETHFSDILERIQCIFSDHKSFGARRVAIICIVSIVERAMYEGLSSEDINEFYNKAVDLSRHLKKKDK
jgi:hypothetical protein